MPLVSYIRLANKDGKPKGKVLKDAENDIEMGWHILSVLSPIRRGDFEFEIVKARSSREIASPAIPQVANYFGIRDEREKKCREPHRKCSPPA